MLTEGWFVTTGNTLQDFLPEGWMKIGLTTNFGSEEFYKIQDITQKLL